jgi:hypothetical protein
VILTPEPFDDFPRPQRNGESAVPCSDGRR